MSTCPSNPPSRDSTNLTGPFEGGHHYLHYFHHSLASGQTKGTQPLPSTENLIKDLLSTAPPIRTKHSFPLSQSIPSGSFYKPSEGRHNENHNHRKLIKLTTALSNSMKLWAIPCRATQDGRVMVESSDKMWSTGEGKWQTTSAFLPWEPHEQYDKVKDEFFRSVRVQHAAREEQRNSSRRNEDAEPKWKQPPAVGVTGDESKVWCCKGTWNVRPTNQGKLEVVKQEMARVNINILRIIQIK